MQIYPRLWHLGTALLLLLMEILLATRFKGYPLLRGSFNDFLVVILIYVTVQAVRPFKPIPLATGVFVFACLVETLQSFKLADRLSLTGIWHILLGNTFSWGDILMYGLGCCAAVPWDLFGQRLLKRVQDRRDGFGI